jgi:hypothetical protein
MPEGVSASPDQRQRVVAIHQPNFLPWLGYFDKLARADVFILLDDVQFQKGAGTWTNRTQLVVGGGIAWATVPVVRAFHGVRAINEMRIDDSRPWRKKLLRTIEQSYRRAPSFDEAMPLVAELLTVPTDSLAEYNEAGVKRLAAAIGLDSDRFVRASTLDASGKATDRLIELTRAVSGTTYLAGGGAQGYQDDSKFAPAGIRLASQDFQHPRYSQLTDEWQSGLSIVDALMNCGFEGTGALLAQGIG